MPNTNPYKIHFVSGLLEVLLTVLIVDTLYDLHNRSLNNALEDMAILNVKMTLDPVINNFKQRIKKMCNISTSDLREISIDDLKGIYDPNAMNDTFILYFTGIESTWESIKEGVKLLDPHKSFALIRMLHDFNNNNINMSEILRDGIQNRQIYFKALDNGTINLPHDIQQFYFALRENVNRNIIWLQKYQDLISRTKLPSRRLE
jgi:hypothetical protein